MLITLFPVGKCALDEWTSFREKIDNRTDFKPPEVTENLVLFTRDARLMKTRNGIGLLGSFSGQNQDQRMRYLGYFICVSAFVWLWPGTVLAEHSLWRVEHGGKQLFLQGSVHLLKPSHYPLPETVESAFSESACLVLEVDLNQMVKPEQQRRITLLSTLPHGDSLKDALGNKLYARVRSALTTLDLPPGAFDRYKPWFVAMSMTRARLGQLGYDPSLGLDAHFFSRAMKEGKPIYGLETLEDQLRLLDALPTRVQREMVDQTLNELRTIETEVEKILAAWIRGDMAYIEANYLAKFRQYPRVYDALIRQRNRAWLSKIRGHMNSDQTCLVVVGAAHLAGPDGLVNTLEQAGYRLTQY